MSLQKRPRPAGGIARESARVNVSLAGNVLAIVCGVLSVSLAAPARGTDLVSIGLGFVAGLLVSFFSRYQCDVVAEPGDDDGRD